IEGKKPEARAAQPDRAVFGDVGEVAGVAERITGEFAGAGMKKMKPLIAADPDPSLLIYIGACELIGGGGSLILRIMPE
ncbi:MAG: hypothetical protein KDC32_28585, partial [Saprospiraceae bacterium]|nr:hypothetical protein [Saprospiraceae bacterium]